MTKPIAPDELRELREFDRQKRRTIKSRRIAAAKLRLDAESLERQADTLRRKADAMDDETQEKYVDLIRWDFDPMSADGAHDA